MEQTVDLSPYAEDGVRDYPLSLEMRVPIVRTAYPRWNYITAIVVGFWDHIVNEPTLVAVMDRVHTFLGEVSDRWLSWKADHSDIFGGV